MSSIDLPYDVLSSRPFDGIMWKAGGGAGWTHQHAQQSFWTSLVAMSVHTNSSSHNHAQRKSI